MSFFQFEDSDVSELLFSLNMWFYSFLLKLLPCVVLTVFTGWLIHAMYQVRREKQVQVVLIVYFMSVG